MYPTQEQLKGKWWHRLAFVFFWAIVIIYAGWSIFMGIDNGDIELVIWALILSAFGGLMLRKIYYDVILFIAFGKRPDKNKKIDIITKVALIIVIILVAVDVAFVVYSEFLSNKSVGDTDGLPRVEFSKPPSINIPNLELPNMEIR